MAVWTVHDSTSHAKQIRHDCSLIICCSDEDKCAMTVMPSYGDTVRIRSPLGIDEYTIVITEPTDQQLERKCILQYWRTRDLEDKTGGD